jgi:hypothetical protein
MTSATTVAGTGSSRGATCRGVNSSTHALWSGSFDSAAATSGPVSQTITLDDRMAERRQHLPSLPRLRTRLGATAAL